MNEAWFTSNAAAWIGASLGSLLGVAGAIGGVLGSVFPSRGTRKRLVYGFHLVLLALCVILTGAGLAAYLERQPGYVYYVLGYPGLLGTIMIGALVLPVIKKRYAASELRKSIAHDL